MTPDTAWSIGVISCRIGGWAGLLHIRRTASSLQNSCVHPSTPGGLVVGQDEKLADAVEKPPDPTGHQPSLGTGRWAPESTENHFANAETRMTVASTIMMAVQMLST